MSDKLPVEIVEIIMYSAARAFVIEDRASVVSLAISCSTAYHAVAPHLYSVMWCNNDNSLHITQLFADANVIEGGARLQGTSASRVARHVRMITYTTTNRVYPINARDIELFTALESALVSGEFAHNVLRSRALRSLEIWDVTSGHRNMRSRLPAMTHYAIITAPDDPDRSPPRELGPLAEFLQEHTQLTHIGVVILLYKRLSLGENWVGRVARGIQQVLEHSHVAVLAFYIGGASRELTNNLELCTLGAIASHMRGSPQDRERVRIFRDERQLVDHDGLGRARMADANAGIDLWTKARPLLQWELVEYDPYRSRMELFILGLM
jgi:hypothetical protein